MQLKKLIQNFLNVYYRCHGLLNLTEDLAFHHKRKKSAEILYVYIYNIYVFERVYIYTYTLSQICSENTKIFIALIFFVSIGTMYSNLYSVLFDSD